MGLISWLRRTTESKSSIPTGRQTESITSKFKTLSPYRSRTSNILEGLRRQQEETSAVDYARKVVPDVSMAVWNFIRLSNQGHNMYFYEVGDSQKRNKKAEKQWREFAERVNEMSNAGLDGLIDQIHSSAYLKGAMAVESEVNKQRTDIIDIHPIIPQTITWEVEERKGRKVWIPYQQQFGKKVSLEEGKANFFWCPVDPDIDDPRGTIIMAPVLQAIDFQMQVLSDLQAILHHQGYPRNDIEIVMERLMNNMPPDVKASSKKQREWLNERWGEIRETFRNLEPDDDYIHFDDVKVNLSEGANLRGGLDVRAIDELVSVQVLNGLKQMGIVSNRVGGVGETESWGSITFKIFCDGIQSIQRGSKRLMEQNARLWLRINGIQAEPHFEHNIVNWENEEQRTTVKLMRQEFYAIAQLMGWVDADTAAQEVMERDKAYGEPDENIRVSFSKGGDGSGEDDDSEGGLHKEKDNILRMWSKKTHRSRGKSSNLP